MDRTLVSTPGKHTLRNAALALAVVLGALAVWFFGFQYLPTARPVSLAVSALTLPADLTNAVFIVPPAEYRKNAFGYEATALPVGVLTGYAHAGDTTLRLVKNMQGEFSLTVNRAEVINTLLPVSFPTLSPDGRAVAYSQSLNSSGQELAETPIARNALVEPIGALALLYFPATERTLALGAGVAPKFIDQTHIVRIAPGGIIVTDLTTGYETVLLTRSISALGAPILQSPDRSLIAVTDRVLAKTSVYRVTPTTLETVAEFNAAFTPAVLTDTALYELRTESGKRTLWRYPLDGSKPHRAHTFPRTFNVEAIAL